MADNMNSQAVLEKLSLSDNEQARKEFTASGVTPISLSHAEIKKTITVMGVTPDDFAKEYATAEFDYAMLKTTFRKYCKDFGEALVDNLESKALDFSSKMLFELGPYIRTEKKSKGDKAVRFRFPYAKTEGNTKALSIKTVLVSTFREGAYNKMEDGDKMIMTFKQAGLLAIETFTLALEYCYNKEGTMLMTPLCGAIFSRETVADMAAAAGIDVVTLLIKINQSTTAGGQHLAHSDMACAIASTIAATKRVADKNIRAMMILKVVKQYSHKGKEYNPTLFNIFAENALGGVPPGMDPETLIENFKNIQTAKVNLRAQSAAIKQSEKKVDVVDTKAVYSGGVDKSTAAGRR